jgi:hypothetical protein
MRWILATVGLVLAVPLTGCLFWQANDVRAVSLTSLARPAMTRIVYGLDASAGGLGVAMSHYNPATGDAGNCDRDDRTDASTPKDSSSTTYFAFDAPAGEYLVTWYNSTGPLDRSTSTGHFLAPAGQSVYVGTFVNDGPVDYNQQHPIALKRDLAIAKKALGPEGDQLVLAEELGPATKVYPYLCSP